MQDYVTRKYLEYIEKHHHIPAYFDVYNGREAKDYMITLSCHSGQPGGIGNVLLFTIKKDVQ